MSEPSCPRCGCPVEVVWLVRPGDLGGDARFRLGRISEWVCQSEDCDFREKADWPVPPRLTRLVTQRTH